MIRINLKSGKFIDCCYIAFESSNILAIHHNTTTEYYNTNDIKSIISLNI